MDKVINEESIKLLYQGTKIQFFLFLVPNKEWFLPRINQCINEKLSLQWSTSSIIYYHSLKMKQRNEIKETTSEKILAEILLFLVQ